MNLCVCAAGGYVAAGTLFSAAFAARGVDVVDPAARNAGFGFRLFIIPGTIFFWPLLLRRWMQAARS